MEAMGRYLFLGLTVSRDSYESKWDVIRPAGGTFTTPVFFYNNSPLKNGGLLQWSSCLQPWRPKQDQLLYVLTGGALVQVRAPPAPASGSNYYDKLTFNLDHLKGAGQADLLARVPCIITGVV